MLCHPKRWSRTFMHYWNRIIQTWNQIIDARHFKITWPIYSWRKHLSEVPWTMWPLWFYGYILFDRPTGSMSSYVKIRWQDHRVSCCSFHHRKLNWINSFHASDCIIVDSLPRFAAQKPLVIQWFMKWRYLAVVISPPCILDLSSCMLSQDCPTCCIH